MPAQRSWLNSGSCFLLVLIIGGLLFTGCTSTEERQAKALKLWGDVAETATGTVGQARDHLEAVVDLTKSVKDTVQQGVDEVQKRADAVQQGVEMIQEGKQKIDEGLGREE